MIILKISLVGFTCSILWHLDHLTFAQDLESVQEASALGGIGIEPRNGALLEIGEISNFDSLSAKVQLSNRTLDLLQKNGFVVIDNPFYSQEENIISTYEFVKDEDIPIFITSDSLLHLYHIQFDEMLKQIEETHFYDGLLNISKELLADSISRYVNLTADNNLKEAAKLNVAYFSVALSLLEPNFQIPSFVSDTVNKELELIRNHAGFSKSNIFGYEEDYSQYLPRGHYTSSEKLQDYFKALMWYGRINFLLEDNIQTLGASLIASNIAENESISDTWKKIYSVTSFYVGFSDDLGPYEYIKALNNTFAGSFNSSNLVQRLKQQEQVALDKLKVELVKLESPKIYGGSGDNCEITPPFTKEKVAQCLEEKGMRLMGQAFTPDSYVFSNLTGPQYKYSGTGEQKMGDKSIQQQPFTMIEAPIAGPIRGFPRGLDVMAVLNSDRAQEIMSDLGDSNYTGYDEARDKLKKEFDMLGIKEWNRNLYWSWLYTLESLLEEYDGNYPAFMQTRSWQDKELTTALASWSQLRHDTILYTKQSYSEVAAPPPPDVLPPPVVGYIEPVPDFYSRLLSLTNMTSEGLKGMNVLNEESMYRFDNLQGILEELISISTKELQNQELSPSEYDFIANFGDSLDGAIGDIEEDSLRTTIIADVHTDTNTGQVLEEGTGFVKLILVAFKAPDGRILIGAGPVLSYYEFKQPLNDRLTDEMWRELLTSSIPPQEPPWISNFAYVPASESSSLLEQTTLRNDFEEYVNQEFGIKMFYPSDYEVYLPNPAAGDSPSLVVSFISPLSSTSDPYREYVDIVRIEGAYITPTEYKTLINDLVGLIKEGNPTSTITNSTTDYTLAGYPGFKFEYTESIEDGLKLKSINVGAMIDDVNYLIVFRAEDTKYVEYLPVVEQMIDSLVIS